MDDHKKCYRNFNELGIRTLNGEGIRERGGHRKNEVVVKQWPFQQNDNELPTQFYYYTEEL